MSNFGGELDGAELLDAPELFEIAIEKSEKISPLESLKRSSDLREAFRARLGEKETNWVLEDLGDWLTRFLTDAEDRETTSREKARTSSKTRFSDSEWAISVARVFSLPGVVPGSKDPDCKFLPKIHIYF